MAGNQNSLVKARLIDRLTDPSERIEPPLATLTFVEKITNRLLDQLIGVLISPCSEFLLDQLTQIRR